MSETDIVARLRWLDKATRELLPYHIEPGEMTDAADLIDRLSRMREALARLGSNEAFTVPFWPKEHDPAADELLARIDFARAALSPAQKGEAA